MFDLLREEKGQISAEMLIVVAAVIAVALILVSQMQNTAKKGSSVINAQSEKAWNRIEDTASG